jgi:hypothetical protein
MSYRAFHKVASLRFEIAIKAVQTLALHLHPSIQPPSLSNIQFSFAVIVSFTTELAIEELGLADGLISIISRISAARDRCSSIDSVV